MRLDELNYARPSDGSSYWMASLQRGNSRIEVWAEDDYSNYDVYLIHGVNDYIDVWIEEDPLTAQAVFYELMKERTHGTT